MASPAATLTSGHHPALLPLTWLALTFIVFPTHKPWWTYYYIHNAIPLCWCAAIGLATLWTYLRTSTRRRWSLAIPVSIFALCALAWLSGRVYLQVTDIRAAPRLYTALILKEIERFKPFTTCLFTDQPIYSFHSDIPLPPKLGVISLKRFSTGDLTNARLVAELQAAQPGLILIANDTQERPYQDLLAREYRLVYRDEKNLLFAHRSIVKKAKY